MAKMSRDRLWGVNGEEYEGTIEYIEGEMADALDDHFGERLHEYFGSMPVYELGTKTHKAYDIQIEVNVKLVRNPDFDEEALK